MDLVFQTAGDGYWSGRQASVRILKIDIPYYDTGDVENTLSELIVTFDVCDWNVNLDGLIYTDSKFLAELQQHFLRCGFSRRAVDAIDYSEQGMQGVDYVSFDVDETFLREWRLLYEIFYTNLGSP